MKMLPAFDITQVPVELLKYVQRGQWVYAGDRGSMGRFCGIARAGVVLVSWTRKPQHVSTMCKLAAQYPYTNKG